MKLRPAFSATLVALFLLSPAAGADGRQIEVGHVCGYGNTSGGGIRLEVASADALRAIRSMSDVIGMRQPPDLFAGSVPNAMAAIHQGKRIIVYNPEFLDLLVSNPKRKWEVWSVLGHEIGHHLNGHTLTAAGDGWMKELQADYYSGFAMAKLGASKEDALGAMRALAAMYGARSSSASHPPIDERIKEISKGWDEGYAQGVSKTVKGLNDDEKVAKEAAEKAKAEADANKPKGGFCCKDSGYKMCTVDEAPVGDACQCQAGRKRKGKVCG